MVIISKPKTVSVPTKEKFPDETTEERKERHQKQKEEAIAKGGLTERGIRKYREKSPSEQKATLEKARIQVEQRRTGLEMAKLHIRKTEQEKRVKIAEEAFKKTEERKIKQQKRKTRVSFLRPDPYKEKTRVSKRDDIITKKEADKMVSIIKKKEKPRIAKLVKIVSTNKAEKFLRRSIKAKKKTDAIFDKVKSKIKNADFLTPKERNKWSNKFSKELSKGIVDFATFPAELGKLGVNVVNYIAGTVSTKGMTKKEKQIVKENFRKAHKEGKKAGKKAVKDFVNDYKNAITKGNPEAAARAVLNSVTVVLAAKGARSQNKSTKISIKAKKIFKRDTGFKKPISIKKAKKILKKEFGKDYKRSPAQKTLSKRLRKIKDSRKRKQIRFAADTLRLKGAKPLAITRLVEIRRKVGIKEEAGRIKKTKILEKVTKESVEFFKGKPKIARKIQATYRGVQRVLTRGQLESKGLPKAYRGNVELIFDKKGKISIKPIGKLVKKKPILRIGKGNRIDIKAQLKERVRIKSKKVKIVQKVEIIKPKFPCKVKKKAKVKIKKRKFKKKERVGEWKLVNDKLVFKEFKQPKTKSLIDIKKEIARKQSKQKRIKEKKKIIFSLDKIPKTKKIKLKGRKASRKEFRKIITKKLDKNIKFFDNIDKLIKENRIKKFPTRNFKKRKFELTKELKETKDTFKRINKEIKESVDEIKKIDQYEKTNGNKIARNIEKDKLKKLNKDRLEVLNELTDGKIKIEQLESQKFKDKIFKKKDKIVLKEIKIGEGQVLLQQVKSKKIIKKTKKKPVEPKEPIIEATDTEVSTREGQVLLLKDPKTEVKVTTKDKVKEKPLIIETELKQVTPKSKIKTKEKLILSISSQTGNIIINKQKDQQKLKIELKPKQDTKVKQKDDIIEKLKEEIEEKGLISQKTFSKLDDIFDEKTIQVTETVEDMIKKLKVMPIAAITKQKIIEKIEKLKKKKKILLQYTATLDGLGLVAGKPQKIYSGFETRGHIIKLKKPIVVKKHKRKTLINTPFVRKHRRRKPRK